MSKNKKIVISFDDSGEMMFLFDKKYNEIVRTTDKSLYNYFRGESIYNTLPIHDSLWIKNLEWRYR